MTRLCVCALLLRMKRSPNPTRVPEKQLDKNGASLRKRVCTTNPLFRAAAAEKKKTNIWEFDARGALSTSVFWGAKNYATA